MIVRIADQDVELDDLIFQLQRKLPTGQVIHDEIGVSWEVIAENVYFCSRNEIGKYAKHLPRTYYTANQEEAAKATIAVWDKVIRAYQETLPHQEQRRIDVERKWKQERPKYETALHFAARFNRYTDDQLAYIREQTKEADYTPAYDGEYDVLDVAYDKIALDNKQLLLARMRLQFEELSFEQAKKLAVFYEGYTTFAHTPLVACISIMTESAKQQLKETIDSITANTKEQFQRAIYHSKALLDCARIYQDDNVKLRGGQEAAWNSFEEKTKGVLYLRALRMAALVLVFHVWEWSKDDLEILMEYTFCLSDSKRQEILTEAKELLFKGEIQPQHTLEDIKPFMVETLREEEALEHYFKLEIANQVYDM